MAKGPVLIDLEKALPQVTEAPPVPDGPGALPQGAAMQRALHAAARKPSRLMRWLWAVMGALLVALLSAWAWQFVTAWMARAPVVGWAFATLMGVFSGLLLIISLRELAALARLGRIDGLRHRVAAARASGVLEDARGAAARLLQFYKGREDVTWAGARLDRLMCDQMDAEGLLDLVERELVGPLDALAEREVEAAARQVATVTALVPLALVDVVAALTANIRMIRRIAEVYGGRAGTIGAWRLTRAVIGHLVATGAVAVGDDMLEPILGGSILGKLSRRFGEGLVNGALTARVGVAAMEVCRPMPFHALEGPTARQLVKSALTGLLAKV